MRASASNGGLLQPTESRVARLRGHPVPQLTSCKLRQCPTAAFHVTGKPGSGNSAVARELAPRGFTAVDRDCDPEPSHWEDAMGAAGSNGSIGLKSGPRLAVTSECGTRPGWLRYRPVQVKHPGRSFSAGVGTKVPTLQVSHQVIRSTPVCRSGSYCSGPRPLVTPTRLSLSSARGVRT